MSRVFVLRSDAIRARIIEFLSGIMIDEKHPFEIDVHPFKQKRSLGQDRYYWQMLTEVAEQLWVDGKQFSKEAIHEFAKGEFIGWVEIPLPNGRVHREPISTTTLDVAGFAKYVTQVEHWAASNGVFFEVSADYLRDIRRYLKEPT